MKHPVLFNWWHYSQWSLKLHSPWQRGRVRSGYHTLWSVVCAGEKGVWRHTAGGGRCGAGRPSCRPRSQRGAARGHGQQRRPRLHAPPGRQRRQLPAGTVPGRHGHDACCRLLRQPRRQSVQRPQLCGHARHSRLLERATSRGVSGTFTHYFIVIARLRAHARTHSFMVCPTVTLCFNPVVRWLQPHSTTGQRIPVPNGQTITSNQRVRLEAR